MISIEREHKDSALFIVCNEIRYSKNVALDEFVSIRQNRQKHRNCMSGDGDELGCGKSETNGPDETSLPVLNGKAVRFNENDIRPMGRTGKRSKKD